MEREEIMAKKVPYKVWDMADRIMRENEYYHLINPHAVVPVDILGMEITGTISRYRVAGLIDIHRFGRLGYLAAVLGYPLSWIHGEHDSRFYSEVIDCPSNDNLSAKQQQLVREIKYLRDLAQNIMHK